MSPRRWWIIPATLLLIPILTIFPASASMERNNAAPSNVPTSAVVATTAGGLQGTVVNCTSTDTCIYKFHTAKGTGWANSTVSSTSPLRMAFELPGESKASYNLSFSAYTAKITSNYPSTTYWTVGSFLGTDVNTGYVTYGTTNTNYTAICHPVFRWCHYTYLTDNGTIVVHSTKAQITSTSISCSATSTSPGQKVNCTVTVTNGWNASNYPNGSVHISSGSTGPISNKGVCTLSKGTCTFTYTPADDTCGVVGLLAKYPGSIAYYHSSGSISIDVIVSGGC